VSADFEAVSDSRPVGSNLGGSGNSARLPGFLPFAGGAALMLFLVFVTALVARRRFN
jgi:hypothetical protein